MRSSVRAVIVKEGKILCLKLVDCTDEGQVHYYMLPGGEKTQIENMFDAICRHCYEKINAKVKVHDLLFVRDFTEPYYDGNESQLTHAMEHIFLCHMDDETVVENGVQPEVNQIDVEWVPIRDLTDVYFYPQQLRDALHAFCKGDDVEIYLNELI